jgi:hypothetical protein
MAFPACSISGTSRPVATYGEQASSDYSEFGFVGLLVSYQFISKYSANPQ